MKQIAEYMNGKLFKNRTEMTEDKLNKLLTK